MWRELPDRLSSSEAPPERMNPAGSGQPAVESWPAPGQPGEVELTRDSRAPRTAREWVGDHFGSALGEDKLAIAKLLVSELVTNALVHGQGTIVLRARLDRGRLVAEVIDQGHGFEWSHPEADLEQVRGWGLVVVAGGSDRWGIREGANHVWFELNL
jgi:anti-sigma regulatory factor (Ser/Thr protein kinase)